MAYNFTQYHDATRGYAIAHLRNTLPYHASYTTHGSIEKPLKSAVPSSTPHAPRNLINQHGQPIPQKRHLNQRKFLDTNAFKSVSAPNLLTNKDKKQTIAVGNFSTNQKQETKPSKVTTQTSVIHCTYIMLLCITLRLFLCVCVQVTCSYFGLAYTIHTQPHTPWPHTHIHTVQRDERVPIHI